MTSTYKIDLNVCGECDTMMYRSGKDHQLPVEGNECFSR